MQTERLYARIQPDASKRGQPYKIHPDLLFVSHFYDGSASGSIFVNSMLTESFRASVKREAQWSQLFFAIERLRSISGEIDAPGNDIFDTHDPQGERQRFQEAISKHRSQRLVIEQALKTFERKLPAESFEAFAQSNRLAEKMGVISLEVFDAYEQGKKDLSASKMVLLDRTNSLLNQQISALQEELRKTQQRDLEAKNARINELKQYEWLVIFLVSLVVIGAVLYGYSLSTHMKYTATVQRRLSAQINELYRPGKSGRQGTVPKSVGEDLPIGTV
jgi:hypothetical protein